MMDETRMIELVVASQRGDMDAFGELAEHFEPMIFAIALKRLRNRSEAVEVSQDVFVQAIRKLPQLREPERFAGWIKRIAVRMSINRAVRKPKEALGSQEMFGSLKSDEDAPMASLMDAEAAAEVRAGMAKLRELDRQTLVAFYFEGQSLKEMAEEFDSPVGTIKRRLHMARNRLKEELADFTPA